MISARKEDGTMIPTKTFKMPKTMKRIEASTVNRAQREGFHQASIQAVLGSLEVPVKEKKPTK